MMYAIAKVHFNWTFHITRSILDRVDSIQGRIHEDHGDKISSLTVEINGRSRDYRQWDVDRRMQFDVDAVQYMSTLLLRSDCGTQTSALLE
jgi:hypothetical protein